MFTRGVFNQITELQSFSEVATSQSRWMSHSFFEHKPTIPPGKGSKIQTVGFSVWLTHHKSQLWVLWRLFLTGMHRHSCPSVKAHTAPGTTIYSDQRRAYQSVGQIPNVYSHCTVNHILHFLEPSTGVHTHRT